MGTGVHGGFGNTKGSHKYKFFTAVQYEGTVNIDGVERDVSRRIYLRHDIDFNLTDAKGRTNLERMQRGLAPIGNDGNPIQLHHIIQKEVGPLVEVREMTHEEYSRILHGLIGKNMSFRNDPVLDRQYNKFRRNYWKWRASKYLEEVKDEQRTD